MARAGLEVGELVNLARLARLDLLHALLEKGGLEAVVREQVHHQPQQLRIVRTLRPDVRVALVRRELQRLVDDRCRAGARSSAAKPRSGRPPER